MAFWKKDSSDLPEHLIPIRDRFLSMEETKPPEPWGIKAHVGVGGLTHVGFGRASENLLVISFQGRGVFNCTSGERVARDDAVDGYYYDTNEMEADGIGPLAEQRVRLSGLNGGALPLLSPDGWSLDDFVLSWPDHTILLSAPQSDPFKAGSKTWKLFCDSELRAFGFSASGKSLIVASSSDLIIWGRES